jgi:hypothetical protein
LDAIKVLPVEFNTGIKQKHCFLQRGKFNSIGSLKLCHLETMHSSHLG